MQRIQRIIALIVFSGALLGGDAGCAQLGSACGALFSVALGLGAAVGSYYLAKSLS